MHETRIDPAKKHRMYRPTLRSLLTFSLALAASAHAQHRPPKLPLEQAILQVQRQTHGQILSATTLAYGHGFLHRIKVLLPNGHIRILSITTAASKNASDPHIIHHSVESDSTP